jgi:hypothetical protein
MRFPISILLLLMFTLSLPGCSNILNPEAKLEDSQTYSTFDANMYPMNKLICDPLGEPGTAVDPGQGLIGRLYYLLQGERYYSVPEYLSFGVRSSQKLFFSELNVPTRKFDTGFPIQTGGVVKNDTGSDLFEFFALQFSSILVLRPDQAEGYYELALLSDDGAVFKVREDNGQYVAYVSNDGDHPTRFGCGTKPILMNRDSEHVISVEYYQGPRYHISLIPMWRKVSEGDLADPLCGHTGNEAFFDYNNNSTPTAKYNELLARGWEPIQHSNYRLPASAAFNPCASTAPAPGISNFKVESDFDGGLQVSWTTDLPTSGQVLYKNLSSGVEVLTLSDNVLKTSHLISIPEPAAGITFEIKAVAISDQLSRATSAAILYTK